MGNVVKNISNDDLCRLACLRYNSIVINQTIMYNAGVSVGIVTSE